MGKICAIASLLLWAGSTVASEKIVGFQSLVNDVSVYRNLLDSGSSAGQTLQVISINQVKLKWWFQLELTADFNRHLTPGYDTDYYLEAGVLKYMTRKFAVNYQRIYGTFVGKPINQFGVRVSF